MTDRRGITLIELLVSLACLAVFVLYFSAFEQIARQDLFGTERRARIQNEASLVLEHMGRQLKTVIGKCPNMYAFLDWVKYNPIGVNNPSVAPNQVLKMWVDEDQNGEWDWLQDRIRAYYYTTATRTLTYYTRCTSWLIIPIAGCGAGSSAAETLSNRITSITFAPNNVDFINASFFVEPAAPVPLTSNLLTVTLTACWDPDGVPNVCGHQENPEVTMTTTFSLPGVAVN